MKRFLIIFLVVIFGTAFVEEGKFPKNEKGNSSSGDLNPLFLTHTCVKELIGILENPIGGKNAVSQVGPEPVDLFLRYFGWVTETEPANGLAILFADQMKILIGFKKTESITGDLEYFDSWTVVQRNSVIKLLKIFLEQGLLRQ